MTAQTEGSKGVDIDSGTRSQHYGVVQRQRQAWLAHRVRRLREEISELPEETPEKSERRTEETKPKGQKKNTRGDEGAGTPRGDPGLAGVTGAESQGGRVSRAERIERLELGGELWNRTYVPPIEPVRRLELIDVLSGNAARRNGNEQVRLQRLSCMRVCLCAVDPGPFPSVRVAHAVGLWEKGRRESRRSLAKLRMSREQRNRFSEQFVLGRRGLALQGKNSSCVT